MPGQSHRSRRPFDPPRRIPFPELPWNDSFQVFGAESVTNVGELLGQARVTVDTSCPSK